MCPPFLVSEYSTCAPSIHVSPDAFGSSSVTGPPFVETTYVAQRKPASAEVNVTRLPSGVNAGVALPPDVSVSRIASPSGSCLM